MDLQKKLDEVTGTISKLEAEAERLKVADGDPGTLGKKLAEVRSEIEILTARKKTVVDRIRDEEIEKLKAELDQAARDEVLIQERIAAKRRAVRETLVDWYGPDVANRVMYPGRGGGMVIPDANDPERFTMAEKQLRSVAEEVQKRCGRLRNEIKKLEAGDE